MKSKKANLLPEVYFKFLNFVDKNFISSNYVSTKLKLMLSLVLVVGFVFTSIAQNTITGVVKNVAGQPLEGATIKVKNTKILAKTDEKGKFTIKANKGQTLIITYTGFSDNEIEVIDAKPINAVLTINTEQQDDVVVIGYLQQKRPDVSTAVSTVSTQNTEKGGYSNFQQVIAGRAAGVNVFENNSEPGGGINIEIRGISSISGSTQPLYVIDGVPIEQPNMNLNGSSTIGNLFGNNLTANPLSMLNPNDIENIEILKDAAATSLYGSRGANGVVVITTKSGKIGKPKIVINYNQSVNLPQREVQVLGAADFATFANEAWAARRLRGQTAFTVDTPYTAKEIPNLKEYNHQRDLAGASTTRDASISISGGAVGGAKYYVSGQYYDQTGVIPNTYLKRYSGRINYEMPLTPKITLNFNLGVTGTSRWGMPTQTLTSRALNWSPTTPLLTPEGDFNYIWDYRYGNADASFVDSRWGTVYHNARFTRGEINAALVDVDGSQARLNPLLITASNGVQNSNTSNQILGLASVKYKVNNDFSIVGKLSVNQFNSILETFIPIGIPLPFLNYRGQANVGTSQNTSVLYQVNFNYQKKLSPNHTLNTVLVFSAEKFIQKSQRTIVGNFANNITGFYNLSAGNPQGSTSTYDANQLVGSVLQVNYLYKKGIVVNLSARYDGVSKFADGNKYGIFPAASVAWKMEQDEWFKSISNIVNTAKLRVSWGLVGNQAISAYETQNTLTPNFSVWGNNTQTIGFSPARLANPNLTWESTSNSNIALDLSFLKKRINVSIDLYQRRTKNLLFNVQTAPSTGFSSMFDNIGTLSNQGIDFTIGAKIISRKNFSWSVEGNVNFNTNLVEKLRTDSPNEFYTAGNLTNNVPILRIQAGKPVGSFYGLISQGIWDSAGIANSSVGLRGASREGDRRFTDLNEDGVLNDLDRTWIGNSVPTAFGGINTTITYKNFELSAFFSYAIGHQIFNQFQILWGNMGGLSNNLKEAFDRRYRLVFPGMDPKTVAEIREKNKTATQVASGTSIDQRESTDYFVEKADFFRCRDISLSYKLPTKFTKKLKVQNIQVYGNVQNLFMITNYSGFNPEVGASSGRGFTRGIDTGAAPLAISYRFGFTVTL